MKVNLQKTQSEKCFKIPKWFLRLLKHFFIGKKQEWRYKQNGEIGTFELKVKKEGFVFGKEEILYSDISEIKFKENLIYFISSNFQQKVRLFQWQENRLFNFNRYRWLWPIQNRSDNEGEDCGEERVQNEERVQRRSIYHKRRCWCSIEEGSIKEQGPFYWRHL